MAEKRDITLEKQIGQLGPMVRKCRRLQASLKEAKHAQYVSAVIAVRRLLERMLRRVHPKLSLDARWASGHPVLHFAKQLSALPHDDWAARAMVRKMAEHGLLTESYLSWYIPEMPAETADVQVSDEVLLS